MNSVAGGAPISGICGFRAVPTNAALVAFRVVQQVAGRVAQVRIVVGVAVPVVGSVKGRGGEGGVVKGASVRGGPADTRVHRAERRKRQHQNTRSTRKAEDEQQRAPPRSLGVLAAL